MASAGRFRLWPGSVRGSLWLVTAITAQPAVFSQDDASGKE